MKKSDKLIESGYVINYVKPEWALKITPDFSIQLQYAPNAFWRFMQHAILGFKWERLEP